LSSSLAFYIVSFCLVCFVIVFSCFFCCCDCVVLCCSCVVLSFAFLFFAFLSCVALCCLVLSSCLVVSCRLGLGLGIDLSLVFLSFCLFVFRSLGLLVFWSFGLLVFWSWSRSMPFFWVPLDFTRRHCCVLIFYFVLNFGNVLPLDFWFRF
jgi:hypothetical protein